MNEETLLEQMTRVRPEVLNEETLKLFNKIMEVIDERDELQQKLSAVNKMNEDNYNKYCEVLEENKRLKEEYMLLTNASEEYEDELQERINRAIEYIGNKNIGIPRKTREKAIKILGGDVDDE